MVDLLEKPGSENDFISVVDQARALYSSHPWSLGGGGAVDLKQFLDSNSSVTLGMRVESVGFASFPGADDVFVAPGVALLRKKAPEVFVKKFVVGEAVRDWMISTDASAFAPYDEFFELVQVEEFINEYRDHWNYRTNLESIVSFGQKTRKQLGESWWGWYRWVKSKYATPLSITFASVATHNHFVLDRGGKVFKQSAPVIKLPEDATEREHLALLGILNSSVSCFWMKQVFHCKGSTVDTKGARQTTVAFENFYDHNGTSLKNLPVPKENDQQVISISERLDDLSYKLSDVQPAKALSDFPGSLGKALGEAEAQDHALWTQMIALQEELDWHCYRLYGLVGEDVCYTATPPPVALGERSFEIALARRIAAGEVESSWFRRHSSKSTTEVPDCWPEGYRQLVERRLKVIEDNRWIRLVEQPEYKRRWNRDPWNVRQQLALKDWMLEFLEKEVKASGSELSTVAQLADRVRECSQFRKAAELFTNNSLFDADSLVAELVAGDEVPQMAIGRLKPSAIKKFRAWQETWEKQRQEDAIEAELGVSGPLIEADAEDEKRRSAYERAKQQAEVKKAREVGAIAVPPKYAKGDFRKGSYWTLRGKLDVPKERFFSLPGCEKSGDATLVIGWAGMDHLQRAQAIAAWYMERKDSDGWEADQLMPMLVALDELIPWLKQWHNELDPEYGQRMGDFYEGFLFEELRTLGVAKQQLEQWQPPAATRGRGATARHQ